MINNIHKKEDIYTIKSKKELEVYIHNQIKKVFVTALKCIEIRFGKKFDGYLDMRSEILRAGNDASRMICDKIDADFNIEKLPDILTIKFGKDSTGGKDDNEKGV